MHRISTLSLSITLALALSIGGFFAVPYTAHASTGDISAVRIVKDTCTAGISCNGWVAEIDMTGLSTGGTSNFGLGVNNDPANAKIVFTVTSPGYDANGNVTTVTRTIYGTKQLRKPYPNDTTNDEVSAAGTLTVRVALSDFIYSGDTNITANIGSGFYTGSNAVTGISVTNNSTLGYPKTIGHFAIEQRRPVNGTQNIEVFAVQRFAQNSKPVARVVVTATGATSGRVETGYATSMALSSRGDNIPVYSVPLNLSTSAGFTRGELVNIRFTAYPWVGDSSSVLDSTVDAGDKIWKLGPLQWTIMDKMIAVVDPSTGVDATCVASLTQETADASPCLTINGALTKIAATNNSAYTLNRVDGGEVQLKAGTYKTGKYGTQTVTNGYFTITPHSSTNRAGVIFDGYVTSRYQYAYQRYYNVTFNRAANDYIVFAANSTVLILEKINFIDAFPGWYSGDTNTDLEVLDSVTTNLYLIGGRSRLNRNSTFTLADSAGNPLGDTQCILGLKGTGGVGYIWKAVASENNVIVAYTKWLSLNGDYFVSGSGSNIAIVNNLIERTGNSPSPISEISFDNSNIVLWYNTFAGNRFNHENDITAPYVNSSFTNYIGKFNVFNARGDHRADIRDTDASMTGTWNVGYSVGWSGNHNEAIAYGGDDDFFGLYSNQPASGTGFWPPTYPVGYVSDKSLGGTNTGNGNYHLGSAALALNKVPSSQAPLPYDLAGSTRKNDGSGAAGAYEYFTATKAITAFNFASPSATGSIDEGAKTVTLTVPSGTNVTALVPAITYNGASISPSSGVARNFTSPVTYTVTAEDATTQAYTITVTVQADTTPPVITLTGDSSISIYVGDTYTEAGATATDNIDGTDTVTIGGNVDTSTPSTYTVTYDAVDAAGNHATQVTRTVTVSTAASSLPQQQSSTGFHGQSVALPQHVSASSTATATTASKTSAFFTRSLTTGSTGSDVTSLQKFLISRGYIIPAGATGYFGSQTRKALAAYQKAKGIKPAVGYFGSVTRASLKAAALNP